MSVYSPDSWILAAAVPVQTQRGSGSEGRPRRAQTAASRPPRPSQHYCPSRPQQKALLHVSGSVTGGEVHSCVTAAVKVRAPSPRVHPSAPRPGGAGSPSLCPCISAATQNRTEMASRGPEPGSKAALAQVRSLCPTYNTVPASAQWRDSAVRVHTHTHTFFLYIRSHYGLSQEMGHSSPCATAGLCRLSTLNEVVASTNPELPVLPPPVPPAATSLTSLSVGLFLSCG